MTADFTLVCTVHCKGILWKSNDKLCNLKSALECCLKLMNLPLYNYTGQKLMVLK